MEHRQIGSSRGLRCDTCSSYGGGASRQLQAQIPQRGSVVATEGGSACLLSVFAMISNGVDTCREVLLCWHASQCPCHRRGRCLFRHRDVDADVKPPMTRTEEEIGVELAALWKAVSKLASSLMAYRAVCRCARAASHGGAIMEQFDDLPVPQVVEESAVERTDGLSVCGDCAEGSDVGVHGELVKKVVGVKTCLLGPESLLFKLGLLGLLSTVRRLNQYAQCLLVKLDFLGPERVAQKDHVLECSEMALKDRVFESSETASKGHVLESSEMAPKGYVLKSSEMAPKEHQQWQSLLVKLGGCSRQLECQNFRRQMGAGEHGAAASRQHHLCLVPRKHPSGIASRQHQLCALWRTSAPRGLLRASTISALCRGSDRCRVGCPRVGVPPRACRRVL